LRRHVSLVGQIFAILLLTLTLEFAVGIFLDERANHLSFIWSSPASC
jgi:hypothetical protein